MTAAQYYIEPETYDKYEVDTYIEEIRAEHDQVCARLQAKVNELERTLIIQQATDQKPSGQSMSGNQLVAEKSDQGARVKCEIIAEAHKAPGVESADSSLEVYQVDIHIHQQAQAEPVIEETKKPKIRLSDYLIYLLLFVLVAGLYFTYNDSDGAPHSLAGFTFMTVITRSMQDEIPQGSLVITKTVDPNTIEIGDDITYLRDNKTTITHRVVGIYENYYEGQRGFETKGTMNAAPDKQIVLASNVVGKVIFHNKPLGLAFSFTKQNMIIIAIMSTLVVVFLKFLHIFLGKDEPEELEKPPVQRRNLIKKRRHGYQLKYTKSRKTKNETRHIYKSPAQSYHL